MAMEKPSYDNYQSMTCAGFILSKIAQVEWKICVEIHALLSNDYISETKNVNIISS